MLRWIIYVAAGLAGLVVLVAIVGASLPKGHRVSRAATYAAPPAAVFAVIADVAHYGDWRTDVTRVEMLPDDGRGTLFREHGTNGPITYRIEEATPPTSMRTRISDPSLPFGGSWTYALAPTSSGGTSLTITEDGEVYNPIFRFMARFFFQPAATIEQYQLALSRRLGQ